MDSILTPYNPNHPRNISPKGKLHGRTYTHADLHAGHVREREMPLHGFDEHYGCITDFILRCTVDIWERKNIGIIARHYAEQGEIYTPLGYAGPVKGVIEGTTQTLQSFPDRELYSANVIWGGNETDGYLSSHLIRTVMTHEKDSIFGPALSGAHKVDIFTIADCMCKDNIIFREWLIRDNGAYVRQLGHDVEQLAWDMAYDDYDNGITHWWEDETAKRTATNAPLCDIKGRPDTNDATAIVLHMMHDVWKCQYLALVDEYYAYNVQIRGYSGSDIIGTKHLKTKISQLLGGLSNIDFVVEHTQQIDSDAGDNEKFVHVRWSVTGIHETAHIFGKGTKAPLHILGISQFRVINGRIAEEWTVWDELAIWKQIHLYTIRNNPEILDDIAL